MTNRKRYGKNYNGKNICCTDHVVKRKTSNNNNKTIVFLLLRDKQLFFFLTLPSSIITCPKPSSIPYQFVGSSMLAAIS